MKAASARALPGCMHLVGLPLGGEPGSFVLTRRRACAPCTETLNPFLLITLPGAQTREELEAEAAEALRSSHGRRLVPGAAEDGRRLHPTRSFYPGQLYEPEVPICGLGYN